MSVQASSLQRFILHIRSPDSAASDGVVDAIERAGAPVDDCPDVYRATARICTARDGVPQAAFVCVDGLLPPDMEFFSVMRRIRPDLTVYVYGRPAADEVVAQAVAHGAILCTADSVPALLGAMGTEPRPEAAMSVPPQPAQRAAEYVDDVPFGEQQAPASQPVVAPGGETDVPHDPTFDEDDEDDHRLGLHPHGPVPYREPIQVPWLRRSNPPLRVAPSSDEPRAAPQRRRRPPVPEPPRQEPLLTEEEVRALMDDDYDRHDAGEDDGPTKPGGQS